MRTGTTAIVAADPASIVITIRGTAITILIGEMSRIEEKSVAALNFTRRKVVIGSKPSFCLAGVL